MYGSGEKSGEKLSWRSANLFAESATLKRRELNMTQSPKFTGRLVGPLEAAFAICARLIGKRKSIATAKKEG